MDLGTITDRWTDALGSASSGANAYLGDVTSGHTLAQQQVRKSIADAQRRMAAEAAASGNPGMQRAAAFGGANMASAGIGQAAMANAQETAQARQAQIQAALGTAQGYQQQADWQQRKEEADRQFLGGIFSGVAGAAGGAAMMSDASRKTAIAHLRGGDADAALRALEGGDHGPAYQADMDRYIDSRLRREGLDPATMPDAEHERAAVRIMQQTPGGRAWTPEDVNTGNARADALDRSLGDASDTAPWRLRRAQDIGGELEALGSRTDAALHAAVPRAPLGGPPDDYETRLRALGDATDDQLRRAVPRAPMASR